MSGAVAEKRAHGHSPYRQILDQKHEEEMARLARPPRQTHDKINVGQGSTAGTFTQWQVKDLEVSREDGEGWAQWLRRVGEMAQMAQESLPNNAPGVSE